MYCSIDGPKGRRKTDVQDVAAVLRKAGHEVVGLAVDGTPECLRHLAQAQAELVFNLVESFGGDDTKEPHVAAYYDLLGLRYTGSGARGLTLAMDKAVAKKIFSFHGVDTPRWAVVWRGRLDSAHDIDFPVIVKPAREDGSIGIGFDSLGSIKELMERIDQLHAEFDHPVLIGLVSAVGDDDPHRWCSPRGPGGHDANRVRGG
jgi:D-alanine-D-alanine ligase